MNTNDVTTEPPPDPFDPDRLARRAIRQFVARSLIALVVVALATLAVASKLAHQEALHDAKVRGEFFARAVAAPRVDQRLRDGRPGAERRFNLVVRPRISAHLITHIKVWDLDGRIIWADQPGLTGKTFSLPDEVRKQAAREFSLARGAADAETVETDDQLEVYVGTLDSEQRPIVVETYLSASRLDSQYDLLLWRIAPLSLGALALLLLAILPIGVSLSHRLARTSRDRGRMLNLAVRASELERRRVAETLHDGVIQDLAGLAYVLPTITPAESEDDRDSPIRATLIEATELIKADVTELRRILTDLYPPSMEGAGLEAALQELANEAARRGIEVTVSAEDLEHLDMARELLVYRVVREGLLNVISHSGAEQADVRVRHVPDAQIEVTVRDDGRSGSPQIPDVGSGHLGLRILHDAVTDLGGRLTIGRSADGGTELTAVLPPVRSSDVFGPPSI